MSIEYAILVKNKTRLETLIERFNTRAQARFYIEHLGGDFADYENEHNQFHQTLDQIQTQLSKTIKNKIVERSFLPNYLFASNQLIVVLGQDGLVANTAKYSKGRPIVAINPDQHRYDGILLPFNASNFMSGIEQVSADKFHYETMRFAKATLNDGQYLLAFNDLFLGASSHISARYRIRYNNHAEEHSSSGLLVSTRAGSTGWLSSVFNMAYGIAGLFETNLQAKQPRLRDTDLFFTVREPFKSIRTETTINSGFIKEQDQLVIESLMPANGVIFSDGIENDFLHFNSGSIARISLAEETAILVKNQ